MKEGKYTPATLGNTLFSIPLYQRLFEWSESEINQLLSDLYDSYKASKDKKKDLPYYIGMLTVFVGNGRRVDLVDGQQRFTVMMLIAIALNWEDFYWCNEESDLRLSFFAREQDESFVKFRCGKGLKSKDDYENKKMAAGIDCVKTFFQKNVETYQQEEFSAYIKNNMTFFITTLPQDYSLADLNKYFESMNSAGRALENHEILKVELLRSLDGHKEFYTKVWNAVADMNVPLVRKIKEGNKNESASDFRNRYAEAMRTARENPIGLWREGIKSRLLNDVYDPEKEGDYDSVFTSIGKIAAVNKAPAPKALNYSDTGLFSFPLFLLLVLYKVLNKNDIPVAEFFKVSNLLDTFEKYKNSYNVEYFLGKLVYCRLILDYFFIRLTDDESVYSLSDYVYSDEEEGSISSEKTDDKKKLIQFQSMLYVSSTPVTYYRWLMDAFDYIETCRENVAPGDFLSELKKIDNSIDEHKLPCDSNLGYQVIDRYWFWRLDYYLWENRDKYFSGNNKEIADKYIFRRNRSIEHVAPQHPKTDSVIKWGDDRTYLDCFGNLAMISSGQNSSLQNESYEVKKAHVDAYVNKSVSGSVESLKMLKIHEYLAWNVESIKKHQIEMMGVLNDSYVNSY